MDLKDTPQHKRECGQTKQKMSDGLGKIAIFNIFCIKPKMTNVITSYKRGNKNEDFGKKVQKKNFKKNSSGPLCFCFLLVIKYSMQGKNFGKGSEHKKTTILSISTELPRTNVTLHKGCVRKGKTSTVLSLANVVESEVNNIH
jgi:hypothetical protein